MMQVHIYSNNLHIGNHHKTISGIYKQGRSNDQFGGELEELENTRQLKGTAAWLIQKSSTYFNLSTFVCSLINFSLCDFGPNIWTLITIITIKIK